jgi:hypothetical protein
VRARALKLAQLMMKRFIARMELNATISKAKHVGVQLTIKKQQLHVHQASGNAKYF